MCIYTGTGRGTFQLLLSRLPQPAGLFHASHTHSSRPLDDKLAWTDRPGHVSIKWGSLFLLGSSSLSLGPFFEFFRTYEAESHFGTGSSRTGRRALEGGSSIG